jgi:hypothetical protein
LFIFTYGRSIFMDPSLEEEVLLLAVVLDEEEVDEPL